MNVELRQARQVAEDDGEDTGGGWIEGSEMSDGALAQNFAHTIDYIVRGQARRFIDDHNTVQRIL